jgi:diacylglycerol O-acyltransferase
MKTPHLPGLQINPSNRHIESVDTAWLRMGNPNMVINTIFDINCSVEPETLFHYLEDRISAIEKFSCMAINNQWLRKHNMNYSDHFNFRISNKKYDDAISEIVSVPLDENRPLWSFDLIKFNEKKNTLIMRTHHGYGDGSTLVNLLQYIDIKYDINAPVTYASNLKKNIGKTKFSFTYLKNFFAILLLLPDGPSIFKDKKSVKKDVVTSATIDLNRVRAISEHHSCTINDVITSIHTGVLQKFDSINNGIKPSKKIRVTMPANLRSSREFDYTGNAFAHYFLELPINEKNSMQRLYKSKRTIQKLKQSMHPFVIFNILSNLGRMPLFVQNFILKLSARGTSGVMSNVVGPQEMIQLSGYPVDSLAFIVPHGEMAMGLSALSYNNEIRMGFSINANKIDGLATYPKFVNDELTELEKGISGKTFDALGRKSKIA